MKDFPLDFKRGLKSIWAGAVCGKKPSLEACSALAARRHERHDPLSEALLHLALQSTGQGTPALVPRITPMPVAELCQLVLLWIIAGESEAASALAHSIPLDFPWMWCREDEYDAEQTVASLALLKKALKKGDGAIVGGDPYFQALAKNISWISPASTDPILDWSLIETANLKCALAFSGLRTSLGAIISTTSEIRAFGPQGFPLSDPRGFGIRPIAQHGNRWASPATSPEVWFETKTRSEKENIFFELSFFGLSPSNPIAFSFYIKAKSAQIGSEQLKPGTLHRYQGISQPILLGDDLRLESLTPGKLEIIPLAGGGGYWDCEYLAAFEIHPINAKMAFAISSFA